MRKILGLVAAVTAFGTASLAAQDFDPAGNYEFETTVQDQTIAGTMSIEGDDGAWTGLITADGVGEMTISGVEIDGSTMTVFAEVPEAGELIIEVEFDGEEFVGSWALGFDGGELVGRKIG